MDREIFTSTTSFSQNSTIKNIRNVNSKMHFIYFLFCFIFLTNSQISSSVYASSVNQQTKVSNRDNYIIRASKILTPRLPLHFKVGNRVYTTGKELGFGEYGVTYASVETNPSVVIKILFRNVKEDFEYRRSRNVPQYSFEAQVLFKLEQLEAMGSVLGLPFLVMKKHEGWSLEKLIDSNVIKTDDDFYIFKTAAVMSMKALHLKGIVHLDLNRENILFEYSKLHSGHVRAFAHLIDFGFARDLKCTPQTCDPKLKLLFQRDEAVLEQTFAGLHKFLKKSENAKIYAAQQAAQQYIAKNLNIPSNSATNVAPANFPQHGYHKTPTSGIYHTQQHVVPHTALNQQPPLRKVIRYPYDINQSPVLITPNLEATKLHYPSNIDAMHRQKPPVPPLSQRTSKQVVRVPQVEPDYPVVTTSFPSTSTIKKKASTDQQQITNKAPSPPQNNQSDTDAVENFKRKLPPIRVTKSNPSTTYERKGEQ